MSEDMSISFKVVSDTAVFATPLGARRCAGACGSFSGAFHSCCPEQREAAWNRVSISLVWTGVGEVSVSAFGGRGASFRFPGGGKVSLRFPPYGRQLFSDPRESARLGI